MAKYFIGSPILSKAATLSAIGNERSSMPASNLQKDNPRLIWRSSNLTNLYVEFDFGSAIELNFVALFFHRGTTSAQWRIRADDTDTTTTPDYDSGNLNMWVSTSLNTNSYQSYLNRNGLHSVHIFDSAPITNRLVRIDITDGANPDGDFRAGALMVGKGWRLTTNPSYGATAFHRVGQSQRTETAGDGAAILAKRSLPRLDFVPHFLRTAGATEARREFFTLNHEAEDHTPVLIVQDSDASDGYLIQRIGYYTLQLQPSIDSAFGVIEGPVTAIGWV